MDRSWMLNARALRVSKECIKIVKRELDIKLNLSHPDFLLLLKDYIELTESEDLHLAYHDLLSLAGGAEVIYNLKQSIQSQTDKELDSAAGQEQIETKGADTRGKGVGSFDDDNGKNYFKWWGDSKFFKGLSWGQAS